MGYERLDKIGISYIFQKLKNYFASKSEINDKASKEYVDNKIDEEIGNVLEEGF